MLLILLALCQLAGAEPPQPDPPASLLPEGLSFGGAVDVYFAYDLDRPPDHRRPAFLYSFGRANGAAVNLGLLDARYERGPIRASLGLMGGTFAQDNQGLEEPGMRNLYEAQIGLRLQEGVWVDVGLFPSHVGAESAIGVENLSPTRSLTADNSPYYLAGARLTADLSGRVTLSGLLVNGWQTIQQPPEQPGIAGGTQLEWRATDTVSLNWGTWVGLQQPSGEIRLFNDLWAGLTLDRLDGIAWFDLGLQGGELWSGANLQGRYWASDLVGLGGRVEYFADPGGIIIAPGGDGVVLTGASVHLDLRPSLGDTNALGLWRLEVRGFLADRDVFRAPISQSANLAVTTAVGLRF